MKTDRGCKGALRRVAMHQAACEETRLAGEALDALLGRVANGAPPSAEEILQAEARWLEARALEHRAGEAGARPASRAVTRVAVPSSVRRSRSQRGREPITQRSPRIAASGEPAIGGADPR